MTEGSGASGGGGPAIYVGPEDNQWGSERTQAIREAVQRGGARLTGPEEAVAVVWLGSAPELSGALHEGIRWVQLPSAGIESWLEGGTLEDGRVYTSAVGAYAGTVAEHALALMLAGARRLPECARATTWGDRWGRPLAGMTVVILGAGGIGRALIQLLQPFGVEVLAVTRSGQPVLGATESHAIDGVDALWPRGDYFVVAAPSTDATRHMIGGPQLAAMPDHAWVVNVARGSLVDTEALVDALAAGAIGGAALDVTDPEPLPDGHPLWAEPRALITPHSANPPDALILGLARRVEENVARFVSGQDLVAVIDVEAGY